MKKILILVIVVVVAVLAWWSLAGDKTAEAPTEAVGTAADTSPATAATVETELQGLGDEDLDAELKAIDEDLKAL